MNLKLAIFSGIHGDEWQIISPLNTIIHKYQNQLNTFLYIPECSPTAVKNHTRLNSEGIDLNRAFSKNPISPEALEIIKQLEPYKFDLCVDFHEDIDLDGIYLYDSENIEGSKVLSSFRNRIKAFTTLYSGIDDQTDEQLSGYSHEGYRVCQPLEKDHNGNYIYEGFLDRWALIEGKTKHWMTLEIPTNLSQKNKTQVIDIFFQEFILPGFSK